MNRAEFVPGGPYIGMSVARMVLAERLQRFVDAESADRECAHGWLPGEAGCGCWGGEVIRLPDKRGKRRRAA